MENGLNINKISNNSLINNSVIDLKNSDNIICNVKNGIKITNNNFDKKIKGNLIIYEHGLILNYQTGLLKKTQHEDIYYWKPNTIIESNKENVCIVLYAFFIVYMFLWV